MQSSMFTIVRDTLKYISNTTDYDYDVLEERMKEYLQNSGICSATTKTGQLCACNVVPGTLFCKKHGGGKGHLPPVMNQCEAMNRNGSRCIKDARPNHTLCGVHISTLQRRERAQNDRTCVFYHDDDTDIQFCKQIAVSGQWCCRSHEHLNTLYGKTYGCTCLHEYENNASVKRNIILERLLKKQVRS